MRWTLPRADDACMTSLLITNARIHDGSGGNPLKGSVAIVDGRIARIGSGGPTEVPAGVKVIDAGGKALIPGLIDCHVHLNFDGLVDFAGDAASLTMDEARARCVRNAMRHLEAGITTVRDLGGLGETTIEAARDRASGRIKGARILTAISVLTAPGGHAHFIGREIASEEEMRKSVRELCEMGARAIKLVATGGVLTPGIGATQAAFPVETLQAAVEEAHAAGVRVAAHAIGREGIEFAARAGVDSIEHCCQLSEAATADMLSNPTWMVATLSAPHQISCGGEGIPDYAKAKSDEVRLQGREAFARAVHAGVRIAAGTDAGTPFNAHGELWRELELMAECEMPLPRVLQAATREAAMLLGLGDLGTLEAGKIADAVLLDGDPHSSIDAYRSVVAVIQDGELVVDNR